MFCFKCGAENEANSTFCLKCGTKLSDNRVINPSTNIQQNDQKTTYQTQSEIPYTTENTQFYTPTTPNIKSTTKVKKFNIIALIGSIFAFCGLFLPFISINVLYSSKSVSYIGFVDIMHKQYEIFQDFGGFSSSEPRMYFICSLVPIILTIICVATALLKGKATMIFSILTIVFIVVAMYGITSGLGEFSSLADMMTELKIGSYVFFLGLLTNIVAKILDKKIIKA